MIRIRNLDFSYDRQPVIHCPVMDFETGLVHGIIGLNGAGKSTFFNLLSRFLKQASGTIQLNEADIKRKDSSYLETHNYFYSGITGYEYLQIFPRTNAAFRLEQLNELFRLPLKELTESYSTGMKKKLALLAVLQQDRPVYILDEPFNGLDLEAGKVVELMIAHLKAKGRTVFVSAHILAPLLQGCDQIHLLLQGIFAATYTREQFAGIEHALFGDFNKKAANLVDTGF
jgi:ABC-2 type transport system ATP-binding protein